MYMCMYMSYVYVQATLVFESVEIERLSQVQASLRLYCEVERGAMEKRLKLLSKLESAVDGVDVQV